MWFDAPKGETDKSPFEAKWIALGAAAFAGVAVWGALPILYPLAMTAATSFGLK
jgi:NADH-quinone oxidoreductase subunit N